MMKFLIAAAAMLWASPVAAADLTATPSTYKTVAAAAKCGDTVTLAAGDYGAVQVTRYNTPGAIACPADNRIEIRAEDARMDSLTFRAVQGVNWFGGFISAPLGVATPGVTMDSSRFVRFAGGLVTGHKVGVTAVRGSDYEIVGNRFQGLRSDGINVTSSQRVLIESNQVVMTVPIKATYTPEGKLLVDGDHSDGVQAWNTAGLPRVTDVTIRGNYFRGMMQGIAVFDAGKGGVDRFIVENNTIDGIDFWHGITLTEARDSVIRDNIVLTRKGAKAWNFPFQPIKTWVSIPGAINVVACGNTVPAMPGGVGTKPCSAATALRSAK
jgi:polygalacturonase